VANWDFRHFLVQNRLVTMARMGIRVALVDDHEPIRTGLRALLEREADLEVVGEASFARQVAQMAERVRPDVVVSDVRLPDGNGTELCRSIRADHPDMAWVMLSAFNDAEATLAALLAGASGFVLKQIRGGDLVSNIRSAAAGAKCTDAAVRSRALGAIADGAHFGLDETERSVAIGTVEGKSDEEIARSLGIPLLAVGKLRATSFDKVRSHGA
jgi:two-component system, NarL family, response regulator DevR